MRLASMSFLTLFFVAPMVIAGCGPDGAQSNGESGGAGGSGSGGAGAGGQGGGGSSAGTNSVLPEDTTGLTVAGVINPEGGVMVGIMSDMDPSYVPLLHIVKRVNGKVTGDEELSYPTFPFEVPFLDLVAGDAVEIQLDAPGDPISGLPPFTQLARTTVVASKILLLRAPISSYCYSPCDPPGTCYLGECRDLQTPPEMLEEYYKDWANYSYCKPKGAGAPELALSAGSRSFVPTSDGQVVDLVAGPQGGHHLWLALRAKNLRHHSQITLTGHLSGPDIDIFPQMSTAVFVDYPSLGLCEATNLRLIVDHDVDYQQFLGQELQIDIHIEDEDGAMADESTVVNVSNNVVSP
jgi:hypothetical protein